MGLPPNSRIEILSDLVARQIAAGEVIDRPSSVLRELLDNSIDSGADKIEVEVLHHGINLIQVSDNGIGISKEDLKIACLPHATSKIRTSTDLENITSLGFRGEALSSIAAVADLSLISKSVDELDAWQVAAHGTEISTPTKSVREKGTLVRVEHLFQNLSSRRLFLSTPQAELSHLKQIFLKKAASQAHIQFTFKSESQHIHIPPEDMKSRAIRICSPSVHESDFILITQKSIAYQDTQIVLDAILGLPHIALRNRKHIHLYINKRPVKEFKLLQAVEYAYRNVLFGKFPQCVLFLEIPPQLIDVNIHPTKEEVKIRSIQTIRSLVISHIEEALSRINIQAPQIEQLSIMNDSKESDNLPNTNAHSEYPAHPIQGNNELKEYRAKSSKTQHASHRLAQNSTHSRRTRPETSDQPSQNTPDQYNNVSKLKNIEMVLAQERTTTSYDKTELSHSRHWKYKGDVFDTYLIFENNVEQKILLLDFHASHERIIYDILCSSEQHNSLLVPVELKLEVDAQSLQVLIAQYESIGIKISQSPQGIVLDALPAHSPLSADEIADTIQELALEGKNPEELNAKLFASKACRRAIKAGDHVDAQSAHHLLDAALALEHPRCPHGRPLWLELKKQELDKLIGRIS